MHKECNRRRQYRCKLVSCLSKAILKMHLGAESPSRRATDRRVCAQRENPRPKGTFGALHDALHERRDLLHGKAQRIGTRCVAEQNRLPPANGDERQRASCWGLSSPNLNGFLEFLSFASKSLKLAREHHLVMSGQYVISMQGCWRQLVIVTWRTQPLGQLPA